MLNLASYRRARSLIRKSAPSDLRYLLSFPQNGELGEIVTEFVGFPIEQLQDLRGRPMLSWQSMTERERDFVLDTGTILIGCFLGTGYAAKALYTVASWRHLEGCDDLPKENIQEWERRVEDLDDIKSQFRSLFDRLKGTDFECYASDDAEEGLAIILASIDAKREVAELVAGGERSLYGKVFDKAGRKYPKPSQRGPKDKWQNHAALLEFSVRLARKRDITVSKSRNDYDHRQPKGKFQRLMFRMQEAFEGTENLRFKVEAITLVDRAVRIAESIEENEGRLRSEH